MTDESVLVKVAPSNQSQIKPFYLNQTRPLIMGIINLAPDSFSEVGRVNDPNQVLDYANSLKQQGADCLDIGAEATNPKLSLGLSVTEELQRILPVVELLAKHIEIPISIDTSRPQVMRECVRLGASMINDVRALSRDQAMTTVAKLNVPVCLMHMAYHDGKHVNSVPWLSPGQDVVTIIIEYLQAKIEKCIAAGIKREHIIIDPGLGAGNFGKSTQHNLQILKRLPEFKLLGVPILIGASRKTFIGDILNQPASKRLYGSIATAVIAAINGATIIRVHDVKATSDALQISQAILTEGVLA